MARVHAKVLQAAEMLLIECMCLSPQLLLVGCLWETLHIANCERRDVFAEALEELVVGILADQQNWL